nr:bifunctional riboflavin kinase/FMN adenylyltransferase [Candidatus Gracilibacteria bacterium]
MKIIEGIENINELFNNLCIALGTFDGIHPGHKKVINGAIQRAKELNGTSMVFTFSPHPLKVITSSFG